MNKSILHVVIFAASVFFLSSCDKIKDTLFPAFESDLADVQLTIPVTASNQQVTASNSVQINVDSVIKAYTANSFGVENLRSLKIKDLGVFINNADSANNLANFSAVTFSISAGAENALVANAVIADAYATSVNIDAANSPELKTMLAGNSLNYTLTATTRRATSKALTATVLVTLSLK